MPVPKLNPESFKLTAQSHGDWHVDAAAPNVNARYHIWLQPGTNIPSRGSFARSHAVFKNPIKPPEGVLRSHRTIKLELDRGEGMRVGKQMLAWITSDRIAAAKQALSIQEAAEEARRLKAVRANRIAEQAEELYALVLELYGRFGTVLPILNDAPLASRVEAAKRYIEGEV